MTATDVYIDAIQRGDLFESGLFAKREVALTHFQSTFSYGGTVMSAELFHQV